MPLNLIDPKIHRHWRRYSAQVSLATGTLGAALIVEQALAGASVAPAVIVAAIASTAFVLFISPEVRPPNQPTRLAVTRWRLSSAARWRSSSTPAWGRSGSRLRR